MKHIRTMSQPAYAAYGLGIGHYLLLAGQVIGIMALLFTDKQLAPTPVVPDDEEDR